MTPSLYPSLQEANEKRSGLSIQGYMLLLVAAIMLPMLALVAIIAWEYGTTARRSIESDRLEAAGDLRHLIDHDIDQSKGYLDGISNAPALRDNDREVIERIATNARSRGFQALIIHYLDGQPGVAAAPSASPVPVESLGLARIAAGDKVFVSNLIAGNSGRRSLYFISVPVTVDGKAVATLSGGLPPERLQRLFSEAGLQEGWSAGIVDRDGTLLARSREPEKWVGQPAQRPLLEAARAAKVSGLFDVVDRDGVKVKNSFVRSAVSGWTAAVAVPAAIVDYPLWRTALIMTAIGVFFTLVALLLVFVLATHLSRAIQRLGLAAVAIAGGDVVKMPSSAIAELHDASRSIEITGARARRNAAMGGR